jgi:hypothetical protein|tara:strand:- start:961 stop:3414 length:2454 start_codon:yes stop_codon:yes gene_type:complete
MTQGSKNNKYGNFPDPFASPLEKSDRSYGLKYAKAIESQWGKSDNSGSLLRQRLHDFEKNRDYANGTQDTSVYKQILNALDPNNGDGTLLNLDWSPVPIVPKFVKVVVNRILSRKPYPSIDAIDPVSKGEKDEARAAIEASIEDKELLKEAKAMGLQPQIDPDILPDTTEEAEIFMEQNMKTNAEIAAQLATSLTLDWNDFDQTVYRRAVEDLVVCGMGVIKRDNDPNYGITTKYVDPANFLHSYTEDPTMSDIVYGGHIKRISIQELKRMAGSEISEEQYEEIARSVMGKKYNDKSLFGVKSYDRGAGGYTHGYDDYLIDIMDFEFLSVDCVYYESKESQFGNTGFYFKGGEYKEPTSSVYDRQPYKMENQTIYGGCYVVGTSMIFGYGMKKNVPKNVHDLTKARLSYSVACTNIRRMKPKSIVGSVIGFADQLQLTHLKIQQAVAKAKPDGVLVDIEGLENVQLGRGGDLQPLEIQDIYEQTGVFYYRSKNPEGGFQNPPIRSIENSIRNINEYINLYNHYLRMIRDATGINEVMDASTPKGDALVGVRQQALAAGNNALYDITNASMVLYRRVCEDIVKCLQVIPDDSVLYRVYQKAVGEKSMAILQSFENLPMYNFGVIVIQEMSDDDRIFLEQNVQATLAQKEIDLEDAMAIRQVKDIDQAQRLLAVKRKKRIQMLQRQQQQNMQAQAQANAQASQTAAQAEMQKMQVEAQVEAQKIQLKGQVEVQVAAALHQMRKELEMIRAQASLGFKADDKEFREKIETLKEDRKDERVVKQAVEQSKLISQRQGNRGELEGQQTGMNQEVINEIFGDE